MSTYVPTYTCIRGSASLSLPPERPHDGTQSDLEYSTGRLTWKMDHKVYLEVYTAISTSSQENSRDKTAGFDDIDADKVIRQVI